MRNAEVIVTDLKLFDNNQEQAGNQEFFRAGRFSWN